MENEKRLIDANDAIKTMEAVYIHFWEDAEDGVEKCVNILHNAPTVDAVEVVRCKDCKHCRIVNGKYFYAYCEKMDYFYESFQTDTRTHFCSFGERME